MKFQKPTKKQLLKALIPALWIGFFLFVVIHMAITSSAAGGAGTYKFKIGVNPYTDDLIGSGANYLVDTNDFRYGSTVVKGWSQREGNTYTVSASSSSSVVFGFDNWTGLTIFYDFVDSSGNVVYTHKATATGYGTTKTTYVYASDLPSTGTYTVVPSMENFPYTSSVTGSITFVALLPDGTSCTLGTVSTESGGTYGLSDAVFIEGLSISWVFSEVNGAMPLPEDSLYNCWYICDKNSRTVYLNYYAPEGRYITFRYYDKNCQYINFVNVPIDETGATIEVPGYHNYSVIPLKIEYPSGDDNLVYSVYCYTGFDESDLSTSYQDGKQDGFDEGFDEGFDQGLENGLAHSSILKQQAYDKGYDDGLKQGLSQNALTGQQMSDLRTDYNAVTGFFDGMWSWMKDLFNTVTEGVAFGGVTVGNIIWTVVIIVVVLFLAGLVI